MKLNLVNKIYLCFAVILIAGIAFKLLRYQSWRRYYYSANVCAPVTHPVYVKDIYFITAGGREEVYISKEAVNGFTSSWGTDDYFSETNEASLLPEKLVLKYASFREETFYNDTIALPTEKIKTVFEQSLKNKKGVEIFYKGQQKPGLNFLVGIANKGNIIVWLRDKDKETGIARVKIKPGKPTEEDSFYGGPLSKEAYLQEVFGRLNDSLKTLIRGGFESNTNYIDSSSGF